MKEYKNIETSDTRLKVGLIRADNGWILEYWEEIEDNKWRKVELVFEDHDEDEDEKASLIEALHGIVEYFGQGGSKYDAKRIDIRYTEKWDKE